MLIIDFEHEYLAERFAEAVEAGIAEIFIEEDFSLEALGEEAKLEYELAKLSGDEERLEKLLKALREEDGIDPEAGALMVEPGAAQHLPARRDVAPQARLRQPGPGQPGPEPVARQRRARERADRLHQIRLCLIGAIEHRP